MPRGTLGKKKVLYVSVVATQKPVAASVTSTRSSVRYESPSANSDAMIGLRKNLKIWNPSFGASFQAPPKALIQPPSPPIPTTSQSGFGSGSAPSSQETSTTIATSTATYPAPGQQPGAAAPDHLAEDRELHRDEILRLVLVAEEGLVDLRQRPLHRVGGAEEHHQVRRAPRVEPPHRRDDHRDHRREHDAAGVLPAGESLVGRVLVHAPGGGVNAGHQADGRGEQLRHRIPSVVSAAVR